jgi:hypothetical protein
MSSTMKEALKAGKVRNQFRLVGHGLMPYRSGRSGSHRQGEGHPRKVLDRPTIGRLRAQGRSWAQIAEQLGLEQLGVGEGTVYLAAHASANIPARFSRIRDTAR